MGRLWCSLACDMMFTVLVVCFVGEWLLIALVCSATTSTWQDIKNSLDLAGATENLNVILCIIVMITFLTFGNLSYDRCQGGRAALTRIEKAMLWEFWIAVVNFMCLFIFIQLVQTGLQIDNDFCGQFCTNNVSFTETDVAALSNGLCKPFPTFQTAAMAFCSAFPILYMICSKIYFPHFIMVFGQIWITAFAYSELLSYNTAMLVTDALVGTALGVMYAATAARSIFGGVFGHVPSSPGGRKSGPMIEMKELKKPKNDVAGNQPLIEPSGVNSIQA